VVGALVTDRAERQPKNSCGYQDSIIPSLTKEISRIDTRRQSSFSYTDTCFSSNVYHKKYLELRKKVAMLPKVLLRAIWRRRNHSYLSKSRSILALISITV
jgi:hypothetical protein